MWRLAVLAAALSSASRLEEHSTTVKDKALDMHAGSEVGKLLADFSDPAPEDAASQPLSLAMGDMTVSHALSVGAADSRLGPVLFSIPVWRSQVQAGLTHAIQWAEAAASRLQNPAFAASVLGSWLGMPNPTGPYQGPHRLRDTLANVLLQAKVPIFTTGITEQMHVINLCLAVKYVLENALVEHGSQDEDRNDCLSNPANAEPWAYVKRDKNDGKKDGHFRIFLCSIAFVPGVQYNEHHFYKTTSQAIGALLAHEAFHQVTTPVVLDQQKCLGKGPAAWCGQCDPIRAQNNGFNWQHMLSAAANDQLAWAKANQNPPQAVEMNGHQNCQSQFQYSPAYLASVQGDRVRVQIELASQRAKVRGVIASMMAAAGRPEEAEQNQQMQMYFTQQRAYLQHGNLQMAEQELAQARALYNDMLTPNPNAVHNGPLNVVVQYH